LLVLTFLWIAEKDRIDCSAVRCPIVPLTSSSSSVTASFIAEAEHYVRECSLSLGQQIQRKKHIIYFFQKKSNFQKIRKG